MEILNAIFPVFALLVLGALLKRFNFTSESFLTMSDRLIYYILFPVMLFWKIGDAGSGLSGQDLRLVCAVAVSVFFAWLVSLAAIRFFPVQPFQAGSFSQAAFRFNSYIGLAVVVNTLGEEGIRHFGILIGLIIPMINFLCVITLIRYGPDNKKGLKTVPQILRALFSNPLIIGCAAGILFSRTAWTFPSFLDNTFAMVASATMPLALISIGGNLKITTSGPDLPLSFLSAAVKLLILPAIGMICMKIMGVQGIFFSTGLIYFALPASPAIYVLSSQMNSDTRLASTSVLVSTLLSFLPLSFSLWLIF